MRCSWGNMMTGACESSPAPPMAPLHRPAAASDARGATGVVDSIHALAVRERAHALAEVVIADELVRPERTCELFFFSGRHGPDHPAALPFDHLHEQQANAASGRVHEQRIAG